MSDTYEEHRAYRFGEFTLDAERGSLFRNGRPVKLRPKSFDVLVYLVERPGKVVSREELLDAVWAGTVVTDESVTQCLIDIRKALNDKSQNIVRTLPRRGYVFELAVGKTQRPESQQTDSRQLATSVSHWHTRAMAIVLGVAVILSALFWFWPGSSGPDQLPHPNSISDRPSIAILPFQSMSQDQSRSYFAEGVSEEIINSLARQPGLKVIARTSSFSFRGTTADVAEIATKLNVSHVLEGSVRNDDDAVRINVQLVDTGSGEYVWTEQYDRELSATTVFAIQTEIATAVVQSLQTTLSQENRARLIRLPTTNMDALDRYFEARQLMETRRPADLQRARVLLQGALDQDDSFALAYVALADTLRLESNYGSLPPQEADERGMRAVQAALTIDEELGEAYASLGNLLLRQGDVADAEQAFLKGIELSPSYAPVYQWYGQLLSTYGGRPLKAVTYLRIAAALDPRSAVIIADYAGALAVAGHLSDAISQFDSAGQIDPAFAKAHYGKGLVLHRGYGRIVDAIPHYQSALELDPADAAVLIYLAEAYADLGDMRSARARVDEAMQTSPENLHSHLGQLRIAALLGETSAAAESATVLAEHWDGFGVALRYLRDRDILSGESDLAMARYEHYYPEFADPSAIEITGWNYEAAIDYGYLLTTLGRDQDADQILTACLQFIVDQPRTTFRGYLRMGEVQIHAIRGETDRAIDSLSNLISDGWRSLWQFMLEHDLALAELREHPGYPALVNTIRDDMKRQRQILVQQQ